MRLGSEESVYRELATLKVGDCGGEAKEGPFASAEPCRTNPFNDEGGEAWMGIGPPFGTNFLLNEGTLKFGAGGEADRTSASVIGG